MAKSKRKRHGLKSTVGEDPGPDISLLSRPTATSVKGIRDVLKAFEEGTAEVHHLLSNECELLYECRVCRSLYRSFLNFITHKRIYCQQQYTSGSPKVSHFFNDALDEDETLVVHDEPVRTTRQTNNSAGTKLEVGNATSSVSSAHKSKAVPRKNLTEILGLLSQKANNSNDVLKRIINLDGYTAMTATSSSDPASAGFKGRTPRQHLLHLESLESTDVAIKQTVTLGPDGKILPAEQVVNSTNDYIEENATSPQIDSNQNDMEVDLICTKCTPNATFSSRKTYRHHLISQHDQSRTSFVCPCCKRHFANSWSVHRHLKTIHGKSTEQLRKLRDQIQTVKIDTVQDEVPNPKPARQLIMQKVEDIAKAKIEVDSTKKTELELFEREMKKCSGCNKRFDRLAAFNYHIRNCQKRHTVLKSKTTRKLPLLRSSSSTKIVSALKTSVVKSEVLEVVAASDSDSTIDPGVDETCFSASNVSFEPRELRNTILRPEQVVTKKIEIQLRRDYNKIVAPTPSDPQPTVVPDETIVVNHNVTISEFPTRPILSTSCKLREQETIIDNELHSRGHTPVELSGPEISSTSSSSNGEVSGCESEQGGETNTDTRLNSTSSLHLVTENVAYDTLELPSTESGEALIADSAEATSKSVASDEEPQHCLDDRPDMAILEYHGLREVTVNKIVEITETQPPQKSILEGILMKDKQSKLAASTSPDDTELTIFIDERKKPLKKRTSVTDWNGFEEEQKSVQPIEQKKKRFKGMDKLQTKSIAMLPHIGSPDRDTSDTVFTVTGGSADIILDRTLEDMTEMDTVEQTEDLLSKNGNSEVLASTIFEDNAASELDDSDDRMGETPTGNSKADVDAEILKVIFEEEDFSHTSSTLHTKGTIIMENGIFSLHPNTTKGNERGTTSHPLFTREPKTQLPKNKISIEKPHVFAEVNKETKSFSVHSLSSANIQLNPCSTSESEIPCQSSSLMEVELMRPSSAIDMELRSFTPVNPEVRSSSAMETESHPVNVKSKRRPSLETPQQGSFSTAHERRQSSDLESETPTSSMESLLTRSRPFRNKAKAKNSDFIYDLSDKVYEDDRLPVRSKAVSKAFQKQHIVEPIPMQLKDVIESSLNPQVMLIRSDESNRLNVGCLKQVAAVKPISSLPGSSKNSLPAYSVNAATRKSVRVVTKL